MFIVLGLDSDIRCSIPRTMNATPIHVQRIAKIIITWPGANANAVAPPPPSFEISFPIHLVSKVPIIPVSLNATQPRVKIGPNGELLVIIKFSAKFCNFAATMSPLYIPSWPPGEHLLSGVGYTAGKCKIRPADERLTIISIHNSAKICQIFSDRNIPQIHTLG